MLLIQEITMKYFTLSGGDEMPKLGLGTWKADDGAAYEAIREAIRIGYRHFDCAARYNNEAEIGQALADAMQDGDVKREDLWITSKLWNNAHQSALVKPNLAQTLRDLRLDYLDLYLIHWPIALKPDVVFPSKAEDMLSLAEVPIKETWQAMEKCVEEGLTKYIGVSNFSVKKIADILSYCLIRPAINQVEGHPFLQQNDLLEYCQQEHIVLTAYSPLGSRDRPARLIHEDEPIPLEHPVILALAEEYGVSAAQILIAWAVCRGTAVIPKSANPKRLAENFRAGDLELACDAMDKIKALDINYRYVDGTFWAMPGSPYTVEELWDI